MDPGTAGPPLPFFLSCRIFWVDASGRIIYRYGPTDEELTEVPSNRHGRQADRLEDLQ
jgi:hypothetical protein